MAYGQAFKDRVLKFYDEGIQTKEIAERLQVSRSWCRRVRQRRHEPPAQRGRKPFKLDDNACTALAGWVKEQPDLTLREIQQRFQSELQIQISIGALWHTLRRMKLTLKKSR